MKRILIMAFTLVVIMTTFSGCDFTPTDITDLMNPPKLTSEEQAIERALENSIGGSNKFTLKYPLEGNYRSAFILHDLDADHDKEALAFYCPTAEKAGTHVMILKKSGGNWKKVSDISGYGNEVDRVEFGDFEGKGYDDIAIGWTLFTGTDLGLGVYSLKDRKYTKVNDSFTEMQTLDMDGDNKTDILLLKLDSASKKAYASLISYKNNQLKEISQTPMDSTVSSYAGLHVTKIDNNNAVLVDGYKGAHSMVTEIVEWKNEALCSPLYDTAAKTVTSTLRNQTELCTDIDNDGVVEIPVPRELPGYENKDYNDKLWFSGWAVFENGTLKNKLNTIMNNAEGYYIICPDNWGNNVSVDNSGGDIDWSFRQWDASAGTFGRKLFDILVYTEDDWDKLSARGNLYRITDNNGIVYAAEMNNKQDNDPLVPDLNTIKQRFKLEP